MCVGRVEVLGIRAQLAVDSLEAHEQGRGVTSHVLQFISAFSKTHVELEQDVAEIKHRVQDCIALLKNSDGAV
jgi:hypothetical protein